jgi:hypothetical protein
LTCHLSGSHWAEKACVDDYRGLQHYQRFEAKKSVNPQHHSIGNLEDYTPQSCF